MTWRRGAAWGVCGAAVLVACWLATQQAPVDEPHPDVVNRVTITCTPEDDGRGVRTFQIRKPGSDSPTTVTVACAEAAAQLEALIDHAELHAQRRRLLELSEKTADLQRRHFEWQQAEVNTPRDVTSNEAVLSAEIREQADAEVTAQLEALEAFAAEQLAVNDRMGLVEDAYDAWRASYDAALAEEWDAIRAIDASTTEIQQFTGAFADHMERCRIATEKLKVALAAVDEVDAQTREDARRLAELVHLHASAPGAPPLPRLVDK